MLYHVDHLRERASHPATSVEIASLLFFDIETTGLRPDKGARVTEIALLDRNKSLCAWSISEDQDYFSELQERLPSLIEHLNGGVVIGHNISFDLNFITYFADKLSIPGPSLRIIDTLSLARKVITDLDSYRLGDLLNYFDIAVRGELHTAHTDAEATRALFWFLVSLGGFNTLEGIGMKKIEWSTF